MAVVNVAYPLRGELSVPKSGADTLRECFSEGAGRDPRGSELLSVS